MDDDDYGGVEYKKRGEREAEAKKTDSKFNICNVDEPLCKCEITSRLEMESGTRAKLRKHFEYFCSLSTFLSSHTQSFNTRCFPRVSTPLN